MRRSIVLLPALLFAQACAPRVLALRAATPLLDRASYAFHREPDPALAREAFPAQLELLQGLLQSDPGNRTILRLSAEGFDGYAFLFLEDSEPERAKALYLRGRDAALEALAPPLRGLPAMNLEQAKTALAAATPEDAPALFWAAYGWGGWVNLSRDDADAVADLPKVAAAMERVESLAPGFYYGGPQLFLGAYEALRPKMLGGDPAKSKAHFETALQENGGRFLLAKVLYAQYYAVDAQDQGLFKTLLQGVLDARPELPQERLANAVAKLKAKRLLEKTNDLF